MAKLVYSDHFQNSVAECHEAFWHPNLIGTPQALPANRIELRVRLIVEEGVQELGDELAEDNSIGVIDALVDCLYVTLGALVEMGHPLVENLVDAEHPIVRGNPTLEPAKKFKRLLEEVLPRLVVAFNEADESEAASLLNEIARKAYLTLRDMNLTPRPYFDEVHASNMSKLGEDGKPIISRGWELDNALEGKFLKGPNYFEPNLGRIYEQFDAPGGPRMLDFYEAPMGF